MRFLIRGGERQQAKSDGEYVYDRSSLPAHDVLATLKPLDMELERHLARPLAALAFDVDRLVEHFPNACA